MSYYSELLSPIHFPRMIRVRQEFKNNKIEDIPQTVSACVANFAYNCSLDGKQVALAVGSRGIKNISVITRTLIDCLKANGAKVFIVPAMGSHGGAKAENQTAILYHLGITEDAMGVAIRSSMETTIIGHTSDGIPVHMDKWASQADYTVSIARIKPHSSFRGKYESGMVKMCVIGLGKQHGADYCHLQGMSNMGKNLEKIGRVFEEKSNLLFSLGIIENAYEDTCEILVVPRQELLAAEPALLEKAKSYLPSIPFQNIDLLVIDEFGKNITGTGMDCNIIQRFTSEHMTAKPFVKRLVTLDLTKESDGNASGFGLADISTRRTFEKMSFEKTYPNNLTARTIIGCRIPMIMENDYDALRAGIKTAPDVDADRLRIVRIHNTLRLDEMEISEAMLDEAKNNPALSVCSEPFFWQFREDGSLIIS